MDYEKRKKDFLSDFCVVNKDYGRCLSSHYWITSFEFESLFVSSATNLMEVVFVMPSLNLSEV